MHKRPSNPLIILFTSLLVAGLLFTSLVNMTTVVHAQDGQDIPTVVLTPTDLPTQEPTLSESPTETETPESTLSETPTLEPTATEAVTSTVISTMTPVVTETDTLQPSPSVTQDPKLQQNYISKIITLSNGTSLLRSTIIGLRSKPEGISNPPVQVLSNSTSGMILPNVPAYTWVYGSAAVSAAMIAGYYDNIGDSNIYTGPTNGGVSPMTDSAWGTWTDSQPYTYPNNPLVASHEGVDGLATRGSIDDYWVMYGSKAVDPFITNGWTEHSYGTAIGDYMRTSQSNYGNIDGSTNFYTYGMGDKKAAQRLNCKDLQLAGYNDDGSVGQLLFYISRGYAVTNCYNQNTDNVVSNGFSFANFKAEIDAGFPVLLNLQGHTVVGLGYDSSTNTVYIHDTWDTETHSMKWGGAYDDLTLISVSIVTPANLSAPVTSPAPISPEGDITAEKPTFMWSANGGVQSYRLQVTNIDTNTIEINQSVTSSACSNGICSFTTKLPLAGINYQFAVASANSSGQGMFSPPMNFRVVNHISPTEIPVLISPNGNVYDQKPTYRWNATTGGTSYFLKVTNTDTNTVVSSVKNISSAICKNGICSYTPTVGLALDGNYQFSVATTSLYGSSDFSAPMAFAETYYSAPFIPESVGPTGTVFTKNPTYQWRVAPSGSAATGYLINVVNTNTNAMVLNNVKVSANICRAGMCTYTPLVNLKAMPNGSYAFTVQAINKFGTSGKNDPIQFDYEYQTRPVQPVLIGPGGTIFAMKPIYQWNIAGGSAATSYVLTLVNTDTNTVVANKAVVLASACKLGICSYSLILGQKAMPNGNYAFTVQAKNDFGSSDLSDVMAFNYEYQSPPFKPTLIGPNETVYAKNPTYQWNVPNGSAPTGYFLTVTNIDTGNTLLSKSVPTSACKNSVCTYSQIINAIALQNGNYQFVVKTSNNFGSTNSDPMKFYSAYQTAPLATTVIGPSGTINTDTPTFSWYASGGSAPTSYVIRVVDTNYFHETIFHDTPLPVDTCKNGICTFTPTSKFFDSDWTTVNLTFQIAAKNSYGQSEFSAPLTFNIYGFDSQFTNTMDRWIKDSDWKLASGTVYTTTVGDIEFPLPYPNGYPTFDYSVRVKRIDGEKLMYFNGEGWEWAAPMTTIFSADYIFIYYQFGHGFESMYQICDYNFKNCISGFTPALLVNDWNVFRFTSDGHLYHYYVNGHLIYSIQNPLYCSIGPDIGMDVIPNTKTTLLVDWATLTDYNSGSDASPQTIDPVQQAMNAEGVNSPQGWVTFEGNYAILHPKK